MSLIPYQTYKSTNLQWIERLPGHWELKALKHCIARLGSGGTPESGNPDYWTDDDDEEGMPWVSIGDMTTSPIVTSTQKRITRSGLASKGLEIFPVGSLLYSIYASLGKVATLGIDATFNQAILAIVPDEKTVSQSYLCYWLQSLEPHLAYYASSNTQANLNAAKVLSYPVALPSQEEQLVIARFLDRETAKIDALIAEQQRLIELLQEKRQSVISHAVTKGLNPNAPMKDSGVEWLGEVPEHWVVTPIKHVCKIGNGSTPNKENPAYWQEGHFPWLTSTSVNEDQIKTANAYVTEQALLACSLPIVEPPAVLVGITGQGKTRGMAATLRIKCTINQHLAFLKPHSDNARIDFLRSAIDNLYAYFRRDTDGAGSTKGAITCSQLGLYKVAVPPPTEQEEIEASIGLAQSAMSELMKDAERNVELLQERRSALISAAVTGQIDVRGLVEAEGGEQ